MSVSFDGIQIDWSGYSTIRLENEGGTVVYLDPGRTDYGVLTDSRPEDADFVLVTHTHHYDHEAIDRVSNSSTELYVLDDVLGLDHLANREKAELTPPSDLPYDVVAYEYGGAFVVDGFEVQTVPAYNQPSPKGLNIDSVGRGLQPPGTAVGFHVTVDEVKLFWPGDSDVIDEHRDLEVDVLLPPISQVVTMNRYQAADLVELLEPDLVVPVHYCWKGKTPKGPAFLIADPGAFRDDVESRGFKCEII